MGLSPDVRFGRLREFVGLLAAAPDTDGGVLAVLGALRSALRVEGAAVRLGDDAAARWTVGRSADPAASSTTRWPLVAGEMRHGDLMLLREWDFDDKEASLVGAAADLIAAAIARDAHMLALEQAIIATGHEIARQRAFIECVVDSLPFGMYVVDREYRVTLWNYKRETGLQGVSRGKALGRTIFEVLNRQSESMLKAEFDDVFATGRLQQFQMESSAFGDVRTFRISKIPMRIDGDAVTHVITLGEDVTEWKAAIDRTAQSEKLAALGQLAAGVMHEINNPLATIAACAESISLLRDLEPAPTAATSAVSEPGPAADRGASQSTEMLRIIDLEVHRCKRIVNGLLDFARPKSGERDPVDLNDVARQGIFLLQHHPKYKRVTTTVDIETTPLIVRGNADQLVQVLIALAINALDAAGDGGRVTVRTRRIDGGDGTSAFGGASAALEVTDNGPGIPRALQAKVFEPFFTTKPQGQGTGLGLAICYGIVADHEGQLELESSEGAGATFVMQLPLATEPRSGLASAKQMVVKTRAVL